MSPAHEELAACLASVTLAAVLLERCAELAGRMDMRERRPRETAVGNSALREEIASSTLPASE